MSEYVCMRGTVCVSLLPLLTFMLQNNCERLTNQGVHNKPVAHDNVGTYLCVSECLCMRDIV